MVSGQIVSCSVGQVVKCIFAHPAWWFWRFTIIMIFSYEAKKP